MKIKYLISFLLLSFCSCQKEILVDSVEVYIHVQNDLKSSISLEGDVAFGAAEILPTKGYRWNTYGWFSDTLGSRFRYNLVKIGFANGTWKIDRKCSFFESEPPYYNLCMNDSLSLFKRNCFSVSVEGNDTIYTYKINIADSLEVY